MNNDQVKQESRSENCGPNTGCWVQGREVADHTRRSVNFPRWSRYPDTKAIKLVEQTVIRGVFDK